jgi:ketosteroid isomerase-like protein
MSVHCEVHHLFSWRHRMLIFALVGVLLTGFAALANAADSADEQAIKAKIERWRELFSPGSKSFSTKGYENIFVNSSDFIVFDNFAEKTTHMRSWDEYAATWNAEIDKNFTGLVILDLELYRLHVAGDLAWSAFTFWMKGFPGGKETFTSQHATHVWRKVDGDWRIVHEHLNGPTRANGAESVRKDNVASKDMRPK